MTEAKKRMTAAEALALANGRNPGAIVDDILEKVRAAAESGDTSFAIRGYWSGGDVVGAGYFGEEKLPSWARSAIGILRDLGYKATIRSSERQLVDVWLEVSWA